MSLVPTTAAEIIASAEYHLACVTRGGLHLHVRPLSRELGDSIVIGSRDFQFLCGQADHQYLLVLVRDGKILRGEPKPVGDLEAADVIEILAFLNARMPADTTTA